MNVENKDKQGLLLASRAWLMAKKYLGQSLLALMVTGLVVVPASAQDTDNTLDPVDASDDVTEEVVVTGMRSSLESAACLSRRSPAEPDRPFAG